MNHITGSATTSIPFQYTPLPWPTPTTTITWHPSPPVQLSAEERIAAALERIAAALEREFEK